MSNVHEEEDRGHARGGDDDDALSETIAVILTKGYVVKVVNIQGCRTLQDGETCFRPSAWSALSFMLVNVV